MMTDFESIVLIATVFLISGAVKGVVGLGLPTVSLGLLTVAFDLTTAMALMIVPSFATNLLQATIGGNGRRLIRQFWPLLTAASIAIMVGTSILVSADLAMLSGLLGLLLVLYAAQGLAGLKLFIPLRWHVWAGPAVGAINGVLTGMTGSFVVPGVFYLQAIGLDRNALVQAMGILFTTSTVALAISLQGQGLLSGELNLMSSIALLPAFLGMWLGQEVRKQLSETGFRNVFFCAILLLGTYIVYHAALVLW